MFKTSPEKLAKVIHKQVIDPRLKAAVRSALVLAWDNCAINEYPGKADLKITHCVTYKIEEGLLHKG